MLTRRYVLQALPNPFVFVCLRAALRMTHLPLLAVVVLAFTGAASAQPWPQEDQNAQHTSLSPFSGPSGPTVNVTFNVSLGAAQPQAGLAVGGGRTIYSLSATYDLSVMDGHTGAQQWGYIMPTSTMQMTPALGNDMVFVSSTSGLYAINATQPSLVWSKQAEGRWSSPTLGPDGVMFVSSSSFVASLDPLTGLNQWSTSRACPQTDGLHQDSPTLSADGELVFVTCSDLSLYAFDTVYGSEVWNYQIGSGATAAPVAAFDGTLLVVSDAGSLFSFNGAQGTLRCRVDPPSQWSAMQSLALGPDGSTVYVTSSVGFNTSGSLSAISIADCSVKWTVAAPIGTTGEGSIVVVGSDATVYAAFSTGEVFVAQPVVMAVQGATGNLLWQQPLSYPSYAVVLSMALTDYSTLLVTASLGSSNYLIELA